MLRIIANATVGTEVFEDDHKDRVRVLAGSGIPQSYSTGGFIGSAISNQAIPSRANITYTLPQALISRSSVITAKIYSSNLALFDEAFKALMKEAVGNFEQVSALVYT
jgi:hypothetical protein